MNCVECQTEPLTPEHYCPCCGRKLSLQERQAKESPAKESTAQVKRCLSCGGISADGDLCKPCQQAFAPVLGNTKATTPSNEPAPVAAQKAPTMVRTKSAAPPEKAIEPIHKNVEAIRIEGLPNETAKAVADETAKAHLAKAANPPPPVVKRPAFPPPPPPAPARRSRTPLLIAAAAAIVVAIGAAEGARRFGFEWPMQATTVEQPVQVAATPPEPRPVQKAEGETRPAANPPAQAVARAKPKAVPERRAAVSQSPNERPIAAAPSPVPETAAPVTTKPAALAAKSQAAPEAPTGRFFERNDVDEPPQVANRVEPQLPGNLSARAGNDVVVVRVLVSRSGHPYRINLLRGSRLGRSADDAVVAAVTQWTFSPAMKRGEPVNCWFNIGVPLGRTN